MRERRDLISFLVLEIVVLLSVIASFKVIETKLIAGMVGGALFVSLGIYILVRCKGTRLWRSPTRFMALVHLFGMSLPMVITRFLNYAADFGELRILGLPAPLFHSVSSGIYLLLIMATVFDLIRLRKPATA